ncbi:helix-turn-helix domain-containing protein [Alteromonas sp. 5E99-2]|uniref:helix-turn-helix domain-containing protein n=1 Tax=Alteromonas sp. 5E99-2 TaxID=2817683 RepID=UPI001A988277|nr:helix-turn-helix domain-containing protein [Alteromonas sp. 5E99-2]MBO1256252.1 helix-turn-helix domain-containing protein [Alteromonas sp. 5E99-2]
MDISKVSKLSNLPASTLRYYEEKGLIQSLGRNGLKRIFADNILERLAFISLGQAAGLSLDEIKSMLLPKHIQVNRELLLSKAEELDSKISQLKSISEGLKKTANCKALDHLECPRFVRVLNIANQRRGKSKRSRKI